MSTPFATNPGLVASQASICPCVGKGVDAAFSLPGSEFSMMASE